MGLKSFLVSKYGAITGAVLGVGAGVGANVAIAEGLKEGLAEEARNVEFAKIQSDLGMGYASPDAFKEFLTTLASPEHAGEYGHDVAVQYLSQIDAVGAAAEMTSYYQPTTLMGTAAACAVVVAGYCIARHFAKKSLNSQELEK